MSKLQDTKQSTDAASLKALAEEIRELAEPGSLAVGAIEFQAILSGADVFETAINAAEAQIKAGLITFERVISAQFTTWRSKEMEAQRKIEAKRRELEALWRVYLYDTGSGTPACVHGGAIVGHGAAA
jgi:hypothetical protein